MPTRTSSPLLVIKTCDFTSSSTTSVYWLCSPTPIVIFFLFIIPTKNHLSSYKRTSKCGLCFVFSLIQSEFFRNLKTHKTFINGMAFHTMYPSITFHNCLCHSLTFKKFKKNNHSFFPYV